MKLSTHNPNDTIQPGDGARWGTQRSDAWWREFNAKHAALMARIDYLNAVDAAVDAAVALQAPVALLAVEDVRRAERNARYAQLDAAADSIFGARG